MPELPEVEVVKEGLKKIIKSSDSVKNIEFLRKDLRSPFPFKIAAQLPGQKILKLHRRAKYILFETKDYFIISHLGMTGSWRKEQKTQKVHDHIILTMISGVRLVYNDPRRFGIFDIIEKEKLKNDKRFRILGPEPLNEDEFTADYLFKTTRQRKIPIKSLIMDQKVVVGVGNIYASEALFHAGIRPLARAEKLKKMDCERLVPAIQKVLAQAIELGGSSIRDYVQANGESGGFQDNHYVYARSAEPCRKCRGAIRSQILSGRNTFWCVNCQK